MRTLYLSIILVFLFFEVQTVKSQVEIIDVKTSKRKVTFQVRGALNISNLTASGNGHSTNADPKVGFNIAGLADIQLSRSFYLQTGAMFSSKGAKVDDIAVDGGGYVDASMTAMYIQLPLYCVYKAELPNSYNKLNVAFGPYFAYGVAGKTSYSQGGMSVSDNTFQENGMWNRPDVGLGVEAQFEMEKVVFTLGSEFGLAKVWKREYLTENIHVRNNNVYLSVGYKF